MGKCLTPEQRGELVEGLKKIDTKALKNMIEIDKTMGKPHRFDTHKITPEMLIGMFSDSRSDKSNALSDIELAVGKNNSRYHSFTLQDDVSVTQLLNNTTFYKHLNDPKTVIPMSIALHEVMESIKGESDKARNNGLAIAAVSENGKLPNIPLARVAAVIGRKVMYTHGYKVQGLSPLGTERIYVNLGTKVLEKFAKDGIIELVDNASVINDMVNSETMSTTGKKNKTISTKAVVLNVDKLFTKNRPSSEIDSIMQELTKTGDSTSNLFDGISDSIRRVVNLTTPSQIQLPASEPKESGFTETNDIVSTKTGEKVQKAINEKPFKVATRMNVFFDNLANDMISKGSNIRSVMSGLKKMDPDVVKNVFGVANINEMGVDKTDSMFGKELSKTTPLADLLNNWTDNIKDKPMHAITKYVRNARMHVMNTVLNYQTSKFDRHVATTGTYDVVIKDEPEVFTHLVAGLMDQSKLDYKTILGTTENKELDSLLKMYNENFVKQGSKLRTQILFLNKLSKSDFHVSSNITETIETLQGISDIRDGLKSGTITTDFMTKPDGTASGGSLTFLQALGSKGAVTELLHRLGILSNADKPVEVEMKLADVYAILENAIKAIEDTPVDLRGKDSEELQSLIDTGVFKSLRDLAKDPTMVFVYGQGERSAKITMAASIAERLLNGKGDTKTVLEFLQNSSKDIANVMNLDMSTFKNIEDLRNTPGAYAAVEMILNKQGGVTDALNNLLEEEINSAYLNEYTKTTESIYKLLENAAMADGKDIKVLPALAVMDLNGAEVTAEYLEEHGIPLQKIQEILHKDQGLITREELPAKTTARVNTIHGIDNAILTIATARAMIKYKETYDVDFNGSMPVHDANNADAKFNAILEVEYIQATKDVTSAYSIHDQMLISLKLMQPDINVTDLRKQVNDSIAIKQKELNNFDLESRALFGFAMDKSTKIKILEAADSLLGKDMTNHGETVENTNEEVPVNNSGSKSKGNYTKELFEKARANSPIVDGFLEALDKGLIKTKINENPTDGLFNFDPDTDTVSIGNLDNRFEMDKDLKNDPETTAKLIEHEIIHSYLTGYMNTTWGKNDNRLKYIKVAVNALKNIPMSIVSKYTNSDNATEVEGMERLQYVLSQLPNENRAVNEFIAIVKSEGEHSNVIYKIMHEVISKDRGKDIASSRLKNLKAYVKALWNLAGGAFRHFTVSDEKLSEIEGKALKDIQVDLETLSLSIEAVLSDSMTYKHAEYDNATVAQKDVKPMGAGPKKSKPADTLGGTDAYEYQVYSGDSRYNDFISEQTRRLNELSYAILSRTYDGAGKSIAKFTDAQLVKHVPLYVRTKGLINRTFESNELLQEMVHFMSLDNFKNTRAKNEFISKQLILAQNRTKQDNAVTYKINQLLKGFSKQEKVEVVKTFEQVPMFHLFNNPDLLQEIIDGMSIDDAIKKVSLDPSITPTAVKQAKAKARLLIEGKVSSGVSYNNMHDYIKGNAFKELIALESLKAVPNSDVILRKVHGNTELFNTYKDVSLALMNLTKNVYAETDTYEGYRENMITDKFEEPVKLIPISMADYDKFSYNANGWKVVRKPTKDMIGVAYQTMDDTSMMEGTGVNIEFGSNDLNIPAYLIKGDINLENNNIIRHVRPGETEAEYKLILTQAEKESMGLVKEPGHTLVRSATHIESIKEGQILRDALLRDAFTFRAKDNEDLNNLVLSIKNPDVDHAWLIKLDPTMKYADLDPLIKAKYKPVSTDTNISKIKGFNENVSLVRKDIAPWLVGYKMPTMFANNATMRRASKLAKETISVVKIGMAIVNPIKIASDVVSNKLLLISNNVPIPKIIKYGRETAGQLQSMTELRGEYLNVKLQLAANPTSTSLESKLDSLDKQIKKHPLAPALYNGMMTSISTDMILKDYDTVSGLQADIEKIIGSAVMKDKDHMNVIGKFIMRASKLGFQGEDVMRGIGNLLTKTGATAEIGTTLQASAETIKNLKDDNDVVKYITQFLVTPNSETTKIGSALTQMVDVIDKVTYYRHLKDIGYSEDKAVKEALEMFIDYKVNMPKLLKLPSDYGVFLFPSFWMRAQKIMVNLAVNKTASVAAGEAFAILTGIKVPTIFDANIVSRFNQNQILNIPDVGFDTFIPSNIFRF